jgi:hypothetical protein
MHVVRRLVNRTFQLGGEEHPGWLPQAAAMPLPTPKLDILLDLEIYKSGDGGGYFLQYRSSNGQYNGDTWHESLEDAIEQAKFQFGIEPGKWKVPAE